jgi:hypothetical protein
MKLTLLRTQTLAKRKDSLTFAHTRRICKQKGVIRLRTRRGPSTVAFGSKRS